MSHNQLDCPTQAGTSGLPGCATVPDMTTAPSLRIGGQRYPVVLPKRSDPRLLVSAVVMSVLVIGIAALDFSVSIPQVLSALVPAFIVDFALTLRRTGSLQWPASGLNTATGIALILRVVGTEPGNLWSWQGWYLYALVSGFAVLSKYVIRYRGTHVFNPSNLALVIVFVLLGSGRVEPLDLWWAPFGLTMFIVYAIILGGGTRALSPLRLNVMPAAFWITLAVGLGVLSGSGHCITARWSLQPVCDTEFWWVFMTSPELLFFLFFMITDPKTIPSGRLSRVMSAIIIGLVATFLIAPQTTEFGAKVGLLASLTLLSPMRWLIDRWFPEHDAEDGALQGFLRQVASSRRGAVGSARSFIRGATGGVIVVALAALIVVAGGAAREPAEATPAEGLLSIDVEIDPAALPAVSVTRDLPALTSEVDADALAIALAENLAIEAEAMRRGEAAVLTAADFGPRLIAMSAAMEDAAAAGEWTVADYSFDSLQLRTFFAAGGQGTDLALEATGTITETIVDADGVVLTSDHETFATTFVLRQATDDRWLILDAVPIETAG